MAPFFIFYRKGVAYVDNRDDRSNVWVVDANGKASLRPLTNCTSPVTNAFDYSMDGKKMFVALGRRSPTTLSLYETAKSELGPADTARFDHFVSSPKFAFSNRPQDVWCDRGHFFAMASQLMRRILVDHARRRHRDKRGGVIEDVALDDVVPTPEPFAESSSIVDIIARDRALDRLAEIDEQQVRTVAHFAGQRIIAPRCYRWCISG